MDYYYESTMADSTSPVQRIVAKVTYYVLVCVFSSMGIFTLLVQLFRYGTSFFNVRPRPTPPACLQDPELGEHSYIRLKEVKMHYVKKGDPSKPLMILVHGFPEFWYSWRHQIREFSKDYWVVAVDMRGYGDTDKPSGKSSYEVEHMIGDIKDLIAGLGRTSCHLVAHDWGGAIAFRFAMQHSDMLDSLIILNAPHPAAMFSLLRTNIRQILKSWYIYFFQLPFLPELVLRGNDLAFLEKVFRTGEKGKDAFSDEDIEAFKYTFSKPGAFTPPVNYYRSIGLATPQPDMSKSGSIPMIKAPTLIIWGTNDTALSTSLASLSAAYSVKSEVKLVEGATHWVQQYSPQDVNKYMRQFLSGLSGRR